MLWGHALKGALGKEKGWESREAGWGKHWGQRWRQGGVGDPSRADGSEGLSERWVGLRRACVTWGGGRGASQQKQNTGQNRLSAGQCQAVTSKRPSGNSCKSPTVISRTTSGRHSSLLTTRASYPYELLSFHGQSPRWEPFPQSLFVSTEHEWQTSSKKHCKNSGGY